MVESINPSKLDNPFDQFYLMLTFATELVFKTLIDLVFEQVHAIIIFLYLVVFHARPLCLQPQPW